MRILHVINAASSNYGWSLDLLNGLCGEQLRLGHEVNIVATNLDGRGRLDVPMDVPVSIGRVSVRYQAIDDWIDLVPISVVRRFGVSTMLARKLRTLIPHADVVHIHGIFLYSSMVAASLCQRVGVPYVLTPHGNLDPFTHRKNRLLKDVSLLVYQRRALDQAAAVHFASEGERRLAREFRLKAPQVVIDFGLDVDKYSNRDSTAFRRVFPWLARKKLIVFMGRIAYTKGVDSLVRAFEVVSDQLEDAHLVIIGPDHEGYRSAVEELTSQLHLGDRVTFTGALFGQDKIDALAAADVAVFPAYTETFGFSALEAMACGTPVVISSGASLSSEAASAGGAFVSSPTPDELAKSILGVLRDPDARRVGARGERLIRSRFSWDHVTPQFIRLYEAAARANTKPLARL